MDNLMLLNNNAYDPYGYFFCYDSQHTHVIGFAGEALQSLTGFYPLGNGYRYYNPRLRRFNKPDSYSPFAKHLLNSYAYCADDPINRMDPSGHVFGTPQRLSNRRYHSRIRIMPKISPSLDRFTDQLPKAVSYSRSEDWILQPNRSVKTSMRRRANSWSYTEPLEITGLEQVDSRPRHIEQTPGQEYAWRIRYNDFAFHAKWNEYPTGTLRYQEWRKNMIRLVDLGDDILFEAHFGRVDYSVIREVRQYQFGMRNFLYGALSRERVRLRR
ncbi:RHS repeat-associated core domain-containing protein [Pseudomonas entomophila]|uniref:RHS repeat-associated core domain-containing protein n=1 Tax=Pseudomonas entomophila TaxID=312306 RepID=UPI003EBC00C0